MKENTLHIIIVILLSLFSLSGWIYSFQKEFKFRQKEFIQEFAKYRLLHIKVYYLAEGRLPKTFADIEELIGFPVPNPEVYNKLVDLKFNKPSKDKKGSNIDELNKKSFVKALEIAKVIESIWRFERTLQLNNIAGRINNDVDAIKLFLNDSFQHGVISNKLDKIMKKYSIEKEMEELITLHAMYIFDVEDENKKKALEERINSIVRFIQESDKD